MKADPKVDYEELILKNLSKYKLYEKFNNHEVDSKYEYYCDQNDWGFSNYHGMYELCVRFAKNLHELDKIMESEKDSKERCRYLNFWTNDQIRKKFDSYHDVKPREINSIVSGFFSVSHFVNEASSQYICRYGYNSDFNMDLWKKWKDLYDYIRNKDDISSIFVSNKDLCNISQEYYAHIKSIYQEYRNKCCGDYYKNCPYHLDFNKWCEMDNILNELEFIQPAEICKSPAADAQVIAAQPRVEESGEPGLGSMEELEPEQGVERGGAVRGLAGDLEAGQAVGLSDNGLGFVISIDLPSPEDNEKDSKGNETNPVGTIVGTSLGFVLLLITIYRFTPLGSWINTRIFRKDRLMENMIRNERELLLNNSENGEMNFDNTRYHIMYNSTNIE
ncbi:unnamed protein product [Plasmodium vivax]|uniref:(malaria parasite P. vivax) hypothetical protein n=1 Tax=Plasmodium vivax TaxID=5855 RepID=A0A8S4HIM9_PLAVI|nr:unnamed protein product [Plasmodium vivax]